MDNESQIVHNFLKILTRSPLGVPPSKSNQSNASKKLISTSSELFPGSLSNAYSTSSPKAGSTLPPKQTKDLPRKNSVPKADQADRNLYNSTTGYAKMHESRTVVAGPPISPYSTRAPKAHHEKRASVENITPKPMTSSGHVTTLQEDLFYMNNVMKDGSTIKGGKSRQNVRKESTPKQSQSSHQHYQDVRPSTAKNSSQQNKILGSFFGNTVSSQVGVSSTTPLSKSMMPLKKEGTRPNTAGKTSCKANNISETMLNSKKNSSKQIESPKSWKDSVKKTPGGGGGGGHGGVDSYYQKMNNYMSKQDSYPSSPIFFTPYDNTRTGKQGKGHGDTHSRGASPKNGYTGSKATPSSAKNAGSTSINGKTKGNDLNSSKNHTNLQISIESEEESQANPLQSFVTKVNRNAMFGMQPPSVKNSHEISKGQPPRAHSKEKKNRENTKPKTPNSNHSPAGHNDMRSPKGMKSGTPRAASKDSLRMKYYMTKLEQHHREPNDADYFNQIFRDHFLQSFQAMSYCRTLKPVDPRILIEKKLILPRRDVHKNKKTVVFDLDETLIHCNESTDVPADVIIPITFPNGDIIEAGINIRPFAIEILKELSKDFEIIVFTASHSCYANVVLDFIDPNDEYIQYRLFRDNCIQTEEGLYVKDLRIISNRDLKDMVIVDNAAYSFGYQVDNGIPIIPFYDNYNDRELKYLYEYLSGLKNVPDVREINKKTFQSKCIRIKPHRKTS